MSLQRFREILTTRDPMAEWLKAREAEGSKKVLTRAALLLLLLVPLIFLTTGVTKWTPAMSSLAPALTLMMPLIAAAILLTLANPRPWLSKHLLAEGFLWILFLLLIAGAGYLHVLQELSIPLDSKSLMPVFPNDASRSIVAWTITVYTSIGILISTWGMTGHPRWFAALILLNFVLVIWDEPAFAGNGKIFLCLVIVHALAIAIHRSRFVFGRIAYLDNQSAAEANEKEKRFLSSLLPPEASAKVARNERVADAFSNLTIVFADMVGFTDLSRRTSPGHLVEILNEMFEAADICCEANGLERVKTIGDCYMAVAGGIRSPDVGAAQAVSFASQYIDQLATLANKHDLPIAVRAGIHTGPAIGGVIGTVRPAYDYWGDAVNRASRLESNSHSGRILLSEATWLQIRKNVACDAPIEIEMKGIGMVQAFFVSDGTSPSADVVSLGQFREHNTY